MIATISPAGIQYHHTINTLKYANRAKEIKTHIQKNVGTIDTHVSDYQRMIESLQVEVGRLKKELAVKESQLSTKPTEKASDDELSWLNIPSQEISENVQERINLQKALIELEETNLHNRTELQHLDDAIAKQQAIENDGAVVQALGSRRQVILDNIRDNDEADINYQREIDANEKRRCQLQEMIEEAISNNGNKTYLRILSQYRLLGMANTELQFEMAMRDQIILNQQEAQRNMWNLLMGLGLDEKQLSEIAAKQGILIEDWTMTSCLGFSDNKQSQNVGSGSYPSLPYCACSGQSFAKSSLIFQHTQDIGARSFFKGNWNVPRTFCREEYHSSYYYTTRDNYPTALMRLRKNNEHCLNDGPSSVFGTPDEYHQGWHNLYEHTRTPSSSYTESSTRTSSFSADFQQRQKESWTSISRQQPHVSSSAGTSASQDSCNGLTTHRGWSNQGRFGYSPMEQVPAVLGSNHIFPKFVRPNNASGSPFIC